MDLVSGLIGAEIKGAIGWLIFDNPAKAERAIARHV